MISDGYKGENIVFNAYVSLFIYFFNGVKTVFTRQAVTQGLKKKGGGRGTEEGNRQSGGATALARGKTQDVRLQERLHLFPRYALHAFQVLNLAEGAVELPPAHDELSLLLANALQAAQITG